MPEVNIGANQQQYYDFNTTQQSLNLTLNQLQGTISDLNRTLQATTRQLLAAGQQKVLMPVAQSAMQSIQNYLVSPLPSQRPVYTTPGLLPGLGAVLAGTGVLKARGTTWGESRYFSKADLVARSLMLEDIPFSLYHNLIEPVLDVLSWTQLGIPGMIGFSVLNSFINNIGTSLKTTGKIGLLTMQRGARIAPLLYSSTSAGYGIPVNAAYSIGTDLIKKFAFKGISSEEIQQLYTGAAAMGYLDLAGNKNVIEERMSKLIKHYKEARETLHTSLAEYVALMRDLNLKSASDTQIDYLFQTIRTTALMTGIPPRQAASLALMGAGLFRRYSWGAESGRQGAQLTTHFANLFAPGMPLSPGARHTAQLLGGSQQAGVAELQKSLQFLTGTQLGISLLSQTRTKSGAYDLSKLPSLLSNPKTWTRATTGNVLETIADIRSGNIHFENPEALANAPLAFAKGMLHAMGGDERAAKIYLANRGLLTSQLINYFDAYKHGGYAAMNKLAERQRRLEEFGLITTGFGMVSPYQSVMPWHYISKGWKDITGATKWAGASAAKLGVGMAEAIPNWMRKLGTQNNLQDLITGEWTKSKNESLVRFVETNMNPAMKYWEEEKKKAPSFYRPMRSISKDIATKLGVGEEWKDYLTPGQALFMSLVQKALLKSFEDYQTLRKKKYVTPTEQARFIHEGAKSLVDKTGMSEEQAIDIMISHFKFPNATEKKNNKELKEMKSFEQHVSNQALKAISKYTEGYHAGYEYMKSAGSAPYWQTAEQHKLLRTAYSDTTSIKRPQDLSAKNREKFENVKKYLLKSEGEQHLGNVLELAVANLQGAKKMYEEELGKSTNKLNKEERQYKKLYKTTQSKIKNLRKELKTPKLKKERREQIREQISSLRKKEKFYKSRANLAHLALTNPDELSERLVQTKLEIRKLQSFIHGGKVKGAEAYNAVNELIGAKKEFHALEGRDIIQPKLVQWANMYGLYAEGYDLDYLKKGGGVKFEPKALEKSNALPNPKKQEGEGKKESETDILGDIRTLLKNIESEISGTGLGAATVYWYNRLFHKNK